MLLGQWLGLAIMVVMCVGLIVWIVYVMKKDKKRIKQCFGLQTASSGSHHAKLYFWHIRLTLRGVLIKL